MTSSPATTLHLRTRVGRARTAQFTQSGLAILGLLVLIAGWHVVATTKVFGSSIATPAAVIDVLSDPVQSSVLFNAAMATATEAIVGFLWGCAFAAVAGLIALIVPVLRRGIDQLATIESAIPYMALAPVLVALVARESVPAAMTTATVFFPIYIAVTAGFGSVPAAMTDLCTAFGASRLQTILRVVVPSGLPTLATGLKAAMPLAIVGAVIGEWFGASKGLGPLILVSMRNYQMPKMWAAVTLAAVVAMILFGLCTALEKVLVQRFT